MAPIVKNKDICQCNHLGFNHYPIVPQDGDNRSTDWPCEKCKCESFMYKILKKKPLKNKKKSNKSLDQVKAFIKLTNKGIFIKVDHSYFPLSDFDISKEKLIQNDEGIWIIDDKNGTEKIILE